MKNTINYYYGISIENFIKTDNDYYFYFQNNEYHLVKYTRPYEDIIALYKLNLEMKKRKSKGVPLLFLFCDHIF